MEKMRGKIVYLAGPLTDSDPNKQVHNIQEAIQAAHRLREIGIVVICPHEMGYCGPFALDYEGWMYHGMRLLEVCDAVIRLPGWEDSKGTLREVVRATTWGIPVFDYDA